ncbi:MAG: carbonate dehydratase [Methylococcales bacterium]|jgi:carbonic anhydrase|nr:carbonate dehydratase [Methylococcaceae bacterium]HIL41663.1 carbonate dehydratase [Methylococcales bacterium]
MSGLESLLDRNALWAKHKVEENPSFFSQLAQQQTPKYLWIGCSDSRVSADQIIDLPPGEVFVHRNIANIVVHSDMNCLSVMQYAVEVLEVEHIIVCGHYGCGGVKAVIEGGDHGMIDNWLGHIKDVQRLYSEQLSQLEGDEHFDKLCELNVQEQVRSVCNTTVVQNAWKKRKNLTVHGWVYGLSDGILKELCICHRG